MTHRQLMTRREIWIAVGTLTTGVVLVAIFVLLAGGTTREVQMSSEQQYNLAVLQQKIAGIPAILTAVGALITILVGAVIMIWNQMRKVTESTMASAASTEAIRLSTLELERINKQVVEGQAELTKNQQNLTKNQEDLTHTVDGMATRAEAAAKKAGEAEGGAEARRIAEAAATLLAERVKAELLVERVKTEAAVAVAAVVVAQQQRPMPAPDATAPSTEITSVRIAEAIEGGTKATEALSTKIEEKPKP